MDKDSVAYCGMCCETCANQRKIGPAAKALYDEMRAFRYREIGRAMDNYHMFWQFLEDMALRGGCEGCKAGDGDPECRIRLCALDKQVENCAVCPVLGCTILKDVYIRNPHIEQDNEYLRRCGLEAWIIRQEKKLRFFREENKESPEAE